MFVSGFESNSVDSFDADLPRLAFEACGLTRIYVPCWS